MHKIRDIGIEVQIGTYSLHMHPAFTESPLCRHVGKMSESKYAYDHCLTLPMYHEMTEEDQIYIVQQLLKAQN